MDDEVSQRRWWVFGAAVAGVLAFAVLSFVPIVDAPSPEELDAEIERAVRRMEADGAAAKAPAEPSAPDAVPTVVTPAEPAADGDEDDGIWVRDADGTVRRPRGPSTDPERLAQVAREAGLRRVSHYEARFSRASALVPEGRQRDDVEALLDDVLADMHAVTDRMYSDDLPFHLAAREMDILRNEAAFEVQEMLGIDAAPVVEAMGLGADDGPPVTGAAQRPEGIIPPVYGYDEDEEIHEDLDHDVVGDEAIDDVE